MTLDKIAAELGALALEYADGTTEIDYAAGIEDANSGAITFIGNPHYEKFIYSTKASAVIVGEHFSGGPTEGRRFPALIRVKSPYAAFARALELFQTERVMLAKGIHPTAVVAESAVLNPSCNVGALAVIGERVRIGANTNILPGVVIGSDCIIGENTVIHPNVVLYDHMEIGNNVVIGAGSVIGFDGFGYVPMGNGVYKKIPQIGKVVIEDNVEIGANCAIDRATVEETRICKGAKLDNLIQIAHNVEIGENTVIAAQTGVAGSTKLGRQNIIAGQVGLTGHIETAANVIVGAQSGVSKSLMKPGTYFGCPAKEHRDALRLEGAIRSLPELIARVRKLEEALTVREV